MIDLHIHGAEGLDTTSHDPEAILKIASLLGHEGIKAFLPVVYPGSIENMRLSLETIKKAMEFQKNMTISSARTVTFATNDSPTISLILGAYLEGPFLNPQYAGSLNRSFFLAPSSSLFERLIEGYEDIIKIITISPELPGALELIENAVMKGIKVHLGHSGATYKEALEGKKAGATGITHLFNAMRPLHHREPAIAGLGLLDRDLYVELICDGIHINPEVLRLVFSVKPLDKIIAISDRVAKKPLEEGGLSNISGVSYTENGILRGSLYPLSRAKEVLRELGIPENVIEAVTEGNPSAYIKFGGINDP